MVTFGFWIGVARARKRLPGMPVEWERVAASGWVGVLWVGPAGGRHTRARGDDSDKWKRGVACVRANQSQLNANHNAFPARLPPPPHHGLGCGWRGWVDVVVVVNRWLTGWLHALVGCSRRVLVGWEVFRWNRHDDDDDADDDGNDGLVWVVYFLCMTPHLRSQWLFVMTGVKSRALFFLWIQKGRTFGSRRRHGGVAMQCGAFSQNKWKLFFHCKLAALQKKSISNDFRSILDLFL